MTWEDLDLKNGTISIPNGKVTQVTQYVRPWLTKRVNERLLPPR
jgi:hypothetical protein